MNTFFISSYFHRYLLYVAVKWVFSSFYQQYFTSKIITKFVFITPKVKKYFNYNINPRTVYNLQLAFIQDRLKELVSAPVARNLFIFEKSKRTFLFYCLSGHTKGSILLGTSNTFPSLFILPKPHSDSADNPSSWK